jgi:hypothetical protein
MRSHTQGNPNNCFTVTFLSTFHTDANNPEKEGDQKATPEAIMGKDEEGCAVSQKGTID